MQQSRTCVWLLLIYTDMLSGCHVCLYPLRRAICQGKFPWSMGYGKGSHYGGPWGNPQTWEINGNYVIVRVGRVRAWSNAPLFGIFKVFQSPNLLLRSFAQGFATDLVETAGLFFAPYAFQVWALKIRLQHTRCGWFYLHSTPPKSTKL